MSFAAALAKLAKKVKILTTDILIWDRVATLKLGVEGKWRDVAENHKLAELIDKYDLQPDSKGQLTYVEMLEFKAVFDEMETDGHPGGSASNTIRTMQKMFSGIISSTFVGILGNDEYSTKIREAVLQSGVDLRADVPEPRDGVEPEAAVSFIVVYPNGKRAIKTYPGHAKEFVSEKMFPEELIAAMDIIFLQGSSRKKFEPKVIDHIMDLRWKHGKQLVLALPTTAFQPDYFEWALNSANIILSNADELGYIVQCEVNKYTAILENIDDSRAKGKVIPDEHVAKIKALRKAEVDKSLSRLQNQLKSAIPVINGNFPDQEQVAFITDGGNGAYTITANEIIHVDIHPRKFVKNTLGAGDTSYAGFLVGKLLLGLDNEQSAKLAMALAAAKVQENGPTLAQPIEALIKIAPQMGASIKNRIAALKVLVDPNLPCNGIH